MTSTRRQFLDHSLRQLALLALAGSWSPPLRAQSQGQFQLVDVLPFQGEGRNFIDQMMGEGLNGRRSYDTSALTSKRLVTPTEQFFVRTRYPDHVDLTQPWELRVDGLVESPGTLPLARLMPKVRDLGVHLIECAGSTSNSYYGLMGAAEWRGVPMDAVFDALASQGMAPTAKATHVEVSGIDPKVGVHPGASWIFPIETLRRAGALATHMNGAPLPKDHGYPVRLAVPGWYGCVWIKWMDRLTFLDDTAPPSSQMVEYADRTHQPGLPRLARDYVDASIDPVAMPVRVEQWETRGRFFYRIVGVVWGGMGIEPTAARTLEIRCGDSARFVPVERPGEVGGTTWTLWSHTWRPTQPGDHTLRLRFNDPALRTRRLDAGYYQRTVRIKDV